MTVAPQPRWQLGRALRSGGVASRRVARARRNAGFSLVEILVSLALVGLALVLACELLVAAQVGFVAAAREALMPEPRLLATSLRHDFGGAQGAVEPSSGGWSRGPLTLAYGLPVSPSRWVRYRLSGTVIERQHITAYSATPVSRVLLGAVTNWSWRELAPGFFQLAVGYSEPRLPRWGLRLGPSELAAGEVPKVLELTLGLRGAGGGW